MERPTEGLPPGFQIKRQNREEIERRIQDQSAMKHQKALDDLKRSIPGFKGEPVQYDNDNIPIVDDIGSAPLSDEVFEFMQEQEQMQYTQQPVQHPQQANQAPQQRMQPMQPMQPMHPKQIYSGPQIRQDQEQPQTRNDYPKRPQQPQQSAYQPQPAQQSMQQAYQPSTASVLSNRKHPVLQKLLKSFGIKRSEYYYVDLNSSDGSSIRYHMSIVPEEVTAWAMSSAAMRVALEGETMASSWFQLLNVCAATVAIDNTPIYEIFEIKLLDHEQAELANDPYDISVRIRKIASQKLSAMIWSETQPIAQKLTDFYMGEIVSKYKITSSYDMDINKKFRYICPIDSCTEYLLESPHVENGLEKEFYCKVHGIAMVKMTNLAEEMNIPLA